MSRTKKIVLSVVFILLMAIAAFAGYKAAILAAGFSKIQDNKQDTPESVVEVKEAESFNMLLVGVDKSQALSDVMMLVNVDPDTNAVKLTSIYRDTRVKMGNHYGKINSVYGRDGIDGTIKAISELTGAPIHYYVTVNLEGFVNLIDELGGVEFDVPQDMKYSDPYQDLKIDLKAGMQTLDGEHAMQLVRFRRYLEGDVKRVEVQQNFMKALFEQKFTLANILNAPELFYTISDYVKTNMDFSDIMGNISTLKKMTSGAFQVYEVPGVGTYVGHVSYFLHYPQETYALFTEQFLGTGEPADKNYTDYSKAQWPDGWVQK